MPQLRIPRYLTRALALLLVACCLTVFLGGTVCQAATYHVPADFEKIQDAIDAATHEDVIAVATGTYRGVVKFNGKDINLRSTSPDDPDIVEATIIRPPGSGGPGHWVIEFSGTESDRAVLSGFTITGGEYSVTNPGGAIRGNGTKATIEANIITDNEGGLINDCDGTIEGNRILLNQTGLHYCDGIILNNVIYLNRAAPSYCNATFLNNTIFGNGSTGVSGIEYCAGQIQNCIIWGNGESPADNIRDSSTPSYCCIEGWAGGGEGNIFTDPRFVDPENGNFRLQPDSFCIDSGGATGLITEDIDGVPRPYDAAPDVRGDGSDIDIGAYEFVGTIRANQTPLQPTNLSPPHGATGQVTILELSASPFEDPDPGDFHSGSQWQVDDNTTFASPVYDSGPTPLEKTVARVAPHHLWPSTDYWWRVRYLDHLHGWSEWSAPTGFSIRAAEGIVVPRDYPTIQAAVDAATDGETVTVLPGTYFENVRMNGKNITLQSLDSSDDTVVSHTIIDASGSGSVIRYDGTENREGVLAGFTLTNGGGLPCVVGNGAKPTVRNNRVEFNESGGLEGFEGTVSMNVVRNNGGHGLAYCSSLVEHNLICENRDHYGAGLYYCGGTIRKNIICDNIAWDYVGVPPFPSGRGGGLYECKYVIEGNLIYGNRSFESGSALSHCNGIVRNNTVVENDGPQLYACHGTIENCIIVSSYDEPLEGSSDPTYCFLAPWEGSGTGNLTGDPLFVDESHDDFHLLPRFPLHRRGQADRTTYVSQ